MATVSITKLDRDDPRLEHEPTVRFSLAGGCSIPTCSCSNHPFVAISDGDTWALVHLNPDEADRIRNNPTGVFEFYAEVDRSAGEA